MDFKSDEQVLGYGIKKSSLMYLSLFFVWGLCMIWFNPRFFMLFSEADTIGAKITLSLFILCLDVFWLFGTYYMMLFIFTLIASKNRCVPPKLTEYPKVAILYVTMNDFKYQAALSCVHQDYPKFHLFILDDSLDPEKMKEVDRFKDTFPQKITIIRRNNRKGFKAGSVNNALRNHIRGYPYFAIIDADGVIPKDFLKKLMPYFKLDKSIAFVQGSHRPNPIQPSNFASNLALGIIPLWTIYYGPRNEYGFLIFLGHGGIIRRDAWEEVGGFPEIVSEDLGFSTKIRELGYQGYFVKDVISYEDFPESYQQLRKQQEKYVKGGCEYLFTLFGSFFKSKRVNWFEKVDVLLSCLSLFLPAFYIFFLFVYCIAMPYFFGEEKILTFSLFGKEITLWTHCLLKEKFNSIWTWDFYVVTILNTFAPVLGCLMLIFSHPIKTIRLLFLSSVPYLSLMVLSAMGIINYLLTKKATFWVTGDKWNVESLGIYDKKREKLSFIERLNHQHKVIFFMELALGLSFVYICIRVLNLSLLAFALSLTLGFFVYRYGWDNKILRPLLYLPFLLIIAGISLVGFNLMSLQGVFLLCFAIHF